MEQLFANRVLLAGIFGWFVAQLLKVIIDWLINGKFNIERISGAGGMPSSHSCMVTAMTVAVAMVEGVDSTLFAMALLMAFITLYDAMGVRWQAGLHARVLNKTVRDVEELKESQNENDDEDAPEEEEENESKGLKEFIGHKPMEVLVGVMLGIVVAILVCLA